MELPGISCHAAETDILNLLHSQAPSVSSLKSDAQMDQIHLGYYMRRLVLCHKRTLPHWSHLQSAEIYLNNSYDRRYVTLKGK